MYQSLLGLLNNSFPKDQKELILSFYRSTTYESKKKNIEECCFIGDYMMAFQLEDGDWKSGLIGACEGGHLELIKLMIERGATDWTWVDWTLGLGRACESGHLEIVKFMMEKMVKLMIEKDIYLNWCFHWACRGGHLEIVKFMIEKGADDFNESLINAYYSDHKHIKTYLEKQMEQKVMKIYEPLLNLLSDYFPKDLSYFTLPFYKSKEGFIAHQCDIGDYLMVSQMKHFKSDYGLVGACSGGHLELIKLMIEKGATDWNGGLHQACENGHLEIVKLMIEKGANDWNKGLKGACSGGHLEIVKLMIEKGANDWNEGLYRARSYLEIVNLMIEKGATDWNKGLIGACYGHLKTAKLMVEKGADNLNECLVFACELGHIEIVKLMIENGADDWNNCFERACFWNRPEIVKLMVEKGATNLKEGLYKACAARRKNIESYLKELIKQRES